MPDSAEPLSYLAKAPKDKSQERYAYPTCASTDAARRVVEPPASSGKLE